LDDRQEGTERLLDLALRIRGRRIFPDYAAPLAAIRFSGAFRVEPPGEAYVLLFAYEGCARGPGQSDASPAPFIAPVSRTLVTSPDAEGWALAFKPEAVNQSLAGWPGLPIEPGDDAFLRRDAELLGAVLSPGEAGRSAAPMLLSAEECVFLRRLFSSMAALLENQDDVYWPCRSRSYFLEILYFLWRRPAPEAAGGRPGPARRARDRILSRYAERLSLPDLARELGTNRTSLQEQFKSEYGRTVMEYLGDIRVEAATILMRNTELSLAEIGDRVGYADYSNFFREFRKRRGDTPSRYRETRLKVKIYP
jgi:AraC-like DNA-binding protein